MKYEAPWWLPGGNVQTIWAALAAQAHSGPAPVFERTRWDAPDGDFVDVDRLVEAVPPEPRSLQPQFSAGPPQGKLAPSGLSAAAPDPPAQVWTARRASASGASTSSALHEVKSVGAPLLIVFHGLEGSSQSQYVLALAAKAQARGWAFAVPHFRGCSGELNRAPRAYHSGDFQEIDWLLRRFQKEHAGPVVAIGISLGGNALLRWAGELGSQASAVVSAVASVCSPLDLTASGQAIGRGFNRQVYTRMFLRSMVPKALQKLDQYPGLFDRQALLQARDLYEFDNLVTAPLHGFKNTDDYWLRASAKPHLHAVAVPALALNALNDPFIPAASLPRQGDVSRSVSLWQPEGGGHVGFPTAYSIWDFPGQLQAMPDAVLGFLAQHV